MSQRKWTKRSAGVLAVCAMVVASLSLPAAVNADEAYRNQGNAQIQETTDGQQEQSSAQLSSSTSDPSHGAISVYASLHPELGQPTGEVTVVTGGATRAYEQGLVVWNAASGRSYSIGLKILKQYQAIGGTSSKYGFPTGEERKLRRDSGSSQVFEHGQAHWSAATGAHFTGGGIQNFWASRGWENGWLGYPTGEELSVNGGASQTFQGGTLFWEGKTGAVHSVKGGIRSAYGRLGYEQGWLGFPRSEEQHLRRGHGVSQVFEHGQMHWTAHTGAHATHGGIQNFWASRGWENGWLGYPTGEELSVNGGASQTFQGGTLFWEGKTGAVHSVRQPLLARYGQHHYEQGDLGFPVEEQHYFQQGWNQRFERGTLELTGCKTGWKNPSWAYQVCSHKTASDPQAPQSSLWINDTRQTAVEKYIRRAYQYLNTPYVWDYAMQPGVGVDCAGLVMQSLYADGMNLGGYNSIDHLRGGYHSHDANNMSLDSHFKHIPLSQLRRGDLVFYPGHVAIYLGGNSIIEAVPPRVRVNHNMWYHKPTGAARPLI